MMQPETCKIILPDFIHSEPSGKKRTNAYPHGYHIANSATLIGLQNLRAAKLFTRYLYYRLSGPAKQGKSCPFVAKIGIIEVWKRPK